MILHTHLFYIKLECHRPKWQRSDHKELHLSPFFSTDFSILYLYLEGCWWNSLWGIFGGILGGLRFMKFGWPWGGGGGNNPDIGPPFWVMGLIPGPVCTRIIFVIFFYLGGKQFPIVNFLSILCKKSSLTLDQTVIISPLNNFCHFSHFSCFFHYTYWHFIFSKI